MPEVLLQYDQSSGEQLTLILIVGGYSEAACSLRPSGIVVGRHLAAALILLDIITILLVIALDSGVHLHHSILP